MELSHTHRYSASAAQVQQMLTDRAFRERVCERQHALSHDVTVTGSGAGAEVVVRQTQAMAGAPAIATKLTGDTVTLEQREGWRSPTTAELAISLPGKPVELRDGRITLTDRPDGGCDQVVSGDLRVKVPLVGGKLESMLSDILRAAMRRQGEVGDAWLAQG
jgi:Protein of unknown function (DUF2505)